MYSEKYVMLSRFRTLVHAVTVKIPEMFILVLHDTFQKGRTEKRWCYHHLIHI